MERVGFLRYLVDVINICSGQLSLAIPPWEGGISASMVAATARKETASTA